MLHLNGSLLLMCKYSVTLKFLLTCHFLAFRIRSAKLYYFYFFNFILTALFRMVCEMKLIHAVLKL